ncbi:MAG: hypothetical protein FWE63_01965 [Bacteroidales bacterium]|nr:hypothetical protein [Bacteroidales bacterium]
MNNYPFNVQIEAQSPQQAKELLNSALLLMIIATKQTTPDDFCSMVKKVVEKPSLIKKAMLFM